MATRTIPLTVEDGGYTTAGSGEWVAFFPDSNNSSFGNNNPTSYSITFNSSYLYANYSSNVTMQWKLKFKIGGTWYTIYTGSKTMKKTSSDFSSSGSLSSEVITALKNNSISEVGVYQNGNRVIKGTSSAYGTLTITYTEVIPTLGTPAAPTITQNDNGTYTASWNTVSASNGSGSVQYRLWSVTDGLALSSYSTSTSTTLNIGAYDYAFQFKVQATYSGLTTSSETTTKTFYKPSLNVPSNFKINSSTSYTGATAPLTWTQGAFNYTSGTRTYEIYKGDSLVYTTGASATSYTIPESTTKGWGTSAVTLKIRGKGTSLGNTASGSTIYSSYTSTVSYTYRASVSIHPSSLKVNGGTSYTGATAPLTWSAATFSGGQTPTYSIRIDGTQLTTTTNTSYTIPESTTKSYTSAVTITVVAMGGGATSNATNEITYTYSPTLIGPSNLKINEATLYIGQSATLTWSEASLSNGGSIVYSVRKDGVEFDTTTNTNYTITEDIAKTWGTSAISLTIVAIGGGKTSPASNAVTFTYKPAYKTIKYYNGTSWVKCIVYYHNGTKWIQTDVYYHNGSIWNPIDT